MILILRRKREYNKKKIDLDEKIYDVYVRDDIQDENTIVACRKKSQE